MSAHVIGWIVCPTLEVIERSGREIAKTWRESQGKEIDQRSLTGFLRYERGPVLEFSSFYSFFKLQAEAENWRAAQENPEHWLILQVFSITVLSETAQSGELDLDQWAQGCLDEIQGWPEHPGASLADFGAAVELEQSGQTQPSTYFEGLDWEKSVAEAQQAPHFHPYTPAPSLRCVILRTVLNLLYAIRKQCGTVSVTGAALFLKSYSVHWYVIDYAAALVGSTAAKNLGMDGTACLAAGWVVRSFLNYYARRMLPSFPATNLGGIDVTAEVEDETAQLDSKIPLVAYNIKHLRLECGFSQEQLAMKLGFAKRRVQEHEGGKKKPRPEASAAYAKVFSEILHREISPLTLHDSDLTKARQ